MYLRDVMELARIWSTEKAVWHHAIIDYTNSLHLGGIFGPVIIELVPEGLVARPFDPTEPWERTAIADVAGARQRLYQLLATDARHVYHWLNNNCEHVAHYIADGEFRSGQVRALFFVAAVVGAAVLVVKAR